MVQIQTLFVGRDFQTIYVVDLNPNDRINRIRDHYFESLEIKDSLCIEFHQSIEDGIWQEIKGNPLVSEYLKGESLQEPGFDSEQIYFKVSKLNHDIFNCKCEGCCYAVMRSKNKGICWQVTNITQTAVPAAAITGCVMLIGLGILVLDVWVVKNKPLCDDDEGSACWTEWTLIGFEIGFLLFCCGGCVLASLARPCCKDDY